MRIVQIVPRSGSLGGVRSYAEALGRELAARCGIESDLVTAGSSSGGRDLGASTCLLHYVNYAYQSRGCPVALVRDLRRWRRESGERRLVTFFHEVYATGPFWRSSFWLAPVQRRLAAALARTSDRCATSLDLYARLLSRLHPGSAVVIPVFSTVGEPEAVPDPGRPRARGWSSSAVPASAPAPTGQSGRLSPRPAGPSPSRRSSISVPSIAVLPAEVGGVPVRALGPLSTPEVSAELLAARAGFVAYPPGFLPKSTIFAAYCAHGLLPVCAWSSPEKGDIGDIGVGGAGSGPPYWAPSRVSPPLRKLQALANAAHAWYLPHSLAHQAESFRDLLAPRERP